MAASAVFASATIPLVDLIIGRRVVVGYIVEGCIGDTLVHAGVHRALERVQVDARKDACTDEDHDHRGRGDAPLKHGRSYAHGYTAA
jgi:hypothetical protein